MTKFNHSFAKKDFISVNQFSYKDELDKIFTVADKMKKSILKKQIRNDLKKFCITQLFYQPSTRTFTSFLAASCHLGALTIPIHGMQAYSSAVKGESLPDTIRTVEQTTACDLIILRHPDDNSSQVAADYARVPVINAGSGTREHPTQAVLDLYTIKQYFKKLKNLNIVMLGDLKYGRTVKSLAKLLALYQPSVKISFVSPKQLVMPREEIEYLQSKKIKINETNELNQVLSQADVLYVTRIQKEWFEKEGKMNLYNSLRGAYNINLKTLSQAKKKMIVMHPLPRVGEIAYEVDNDSRAAYFNQMRNGLYIRMALLRLILRKG
jgi:aspartate carbamoyltransferase catalytic subunit